MSAPGSSPRQDPTKCRNGLHDWVEENIYVNPEGKSNCRGCKNEAHKRWAKGQAHPQNAGHCRRGHPYTLENTKKKVKMVNGKKEVHRQCRQCEKDSLKTTRR